MKKKHLIIFGLLAVIAGLVIITNWRFKKWQDDFSGKSLLEPLGFDVNEIGKISSAEETPLKRFSSPDGNLTIDYPVDWVAIEQQEIIGAQEQDPIPCRMLHGLIPCVRNTPVLF